MVKYVGITIGPIYDTMMLSSKPAAMWGASFLFSYLGKSLCIRMKEAYGDKCEIIVPFTDFDMVGDTENPLSKMKEGVGLIHDRIIAVIHEEKSEQEIVTDMRRHVIEPVREELVQAILSDIENVRDMEQAAIELKQYFQIYAVCVNLEEGEKIIPKVSGVLDVFELEKQYISESKVDHLHDFLENKIIKGSFLAKEIDKNLWQLIHKGDQIKSIETIAGDRKYYALVQADGDGMGKVLSNLTSPELVKQFSEKCIHYASKAATVIGNYGGVTIYAGGDDLLFLAPINKGKGDILSLICELRETFKSVFQEAEYKDCHVSYGVQIVYKSFPLYEAFAMVSKMLFDKAKSKRNSCAISVQKHSGQSVEFVLHEFDKNPITEALIKLNNAKEGGTFLMSVSKHFRDQLGTLKTAIELGCIDVMMDNLFDNEMQRAYKQDLELVKELLNLTVTEKENIGCHKDTELPILALLRYADFYSGGGES